MTKNQVFDMLFTLGLMSAATYLGYVWGTTRMAKAYGEAMSAETLMYLAAKDSQ